MSSLGPVSNVKILIKQDTLENKNKQIFWFSKNSYDKRKSEIKLKKLNNYPMTPQGK